MQTVRQTLKKEIWQNLGPLLWVALLMMLLVGFDVIAPWPFKILIDNVLSAKPVQPDGLINSFLARFNSRELLGFFVVFVYFSSTFLLSVVTYLRSAVSKNLVKKLTSDFSKQAFESLQTLAIGFYNKQQIGDYIYRLSYDVSALGELIEDGLLPLITSGLYLLITTTIMFMIDVRLTLLALVALPFLTISLYSFNAYIERTTKKSEVSNSAAFSFIEEALTHLKIIQAFSQEQRQSKIFDQKIDVSLKTDVAVFKLDFLLTLFVGIIIALSYSLIIIYGIRGVFSGTLTTGLLIVFIFYLDNLTNPILSIIYAGAELRKSYTKILRMEDFFTAKTQLASSGRIEQVKDVTLKFDKVSLHGTKNAQMLKHISFEIKPGQRVVIFGASGSGKTSIVNLILRFIEEPSSGQIWLGGRPLADYKMKALREAISFVPQEITLFDDTIRNNIAFGNEGASFPEIVKAAKLAVAHDFIQKLPGGYDYRVGEGGNQLSGGQSQRIMLARALMKKEAKIMLFDETLSALDVKTRHEVLDNLYHFSEDKTFIFVSNIFDVVKTADHVIVINKGKLIFNGSSRHLPKEVSLYKMMLNDEPALET